MVLRAQQRSARLQELILEQLKMQGGVRPNHPDPNHPDPDNREDEMPLVITNKDHEIKPKPKPKPRPR